MSNKKRRLEEAPTMKLQREMITKKEANELLKLQREMITNKAKETTRLICETYGRRYAISVEMITKEANEITRLNCTKSMKLYNKPNLHENEKRLLKCFVESKLIGLQYIYIFI
jgi:wobble nucleotide-excising tRNase